MNPLTKGPISLRALIIDDNPDDRHTVHNALRREFPDLETEEPADAWEFHSALAGAPFDIIVLEYRLRWSTGLNLIPAIKDAQPDCPVIMFTGSGSEQVAVHALLHGVEDYVPKSPGQFRLLADSVRNALEKARMRRRADSMDRKLEELLAGLDVGVYRVTMRGHLIYGNPAFYRILRFASNPKPRTRKLRNLILNPYDQAWIFREMKRTGRVRIPEFSLRHPDGEMLWVSLTQVYRPSKTKGGIIDGIVEDITEKKRLDAALITREAELRKAQKLESIGKLAGGVAHDFNNMLSAILGYCDLLLEADPTIPPERESLQEIHKAAKRAAALTRELLAFGRKQMLFPKVIDVNGVLLRLEPLIRKTLGEGTELILGFGSPSARIKVDPAQLEIVIMNLIQNAHDAMPAGGSLTMRIWHCGREEKGRDGDAKSFRDPDRSLTADSYACLSVSDTGMGMESEIQSRIFEPYFTTKNDVHHSGLGLSTVYGIVNQSGGFILVESLPSRGTTFRLFFPSSAEEEPGWGRNARPDAEQIVLWTDPRR